MLIMIGFSKGEAMTKETEGYAACYFAIAVLMVSNQNF